MRSKEFANELRPQFAPRYNPLQITGDGNQGVYLAEISEGFATTLLAKILLSIEELVAEKEIEAELQAVIAQQSLEGRTDVGETQKRQMVVARRGQGIFRSNVRLNEAACRVTGVTDLRLLIASHIKPWSKSTDKEKLDGCNGLLMSPYVDRLFDRGLIGFADDGKLLRSPRLESDTWAAWSLKDVQNVSGFSERQRIYLAYHRTEIFKANEPMTSLSA